MATEIACSLDPVVWAREKLGFYADPWQARALSSASDRQIYLASRQSGKSTVGSLKALHTCIYQPGSLTLLLSPSLRQSQFLFRSVSDYLRRLEIRPVLAEDNRLSLTMESGSRIVSLPATESRIRGFSNCRLLIVDEGARVQDSLIAACMPFVMVSRGTIVAASTPCGKRGWFHSIWTGTEDWYRERVIADEVPRLSSDFIKEQVRLWGQRWVSTEFYCEFTDTDDAVFNSDDIDAMVDPNLKPLFRRTA